MCTYPLHSTLSALHLAPYLHVLPADLLAFKPLLAKLGVRDARNRAADADAKLVMALEERWSATLVRAVRMLLGVHSGPSSISRRAPHPQPPPRTEKHGQDLGKAMM